MIQSAQYYGHSANSKAQYKMDLIENVSHHNICNPLLKPDFRGIFLGWENPDKTCRVERHPK